MDKLEKGKITATLVWNAIWLIGALIFWISGLVYFLNETSFLGWAIWGLCCCIFVISTIIKITKKSTRDSARDGANTYSASISGNKVTVSNHPFAGAVFGFITGLVMGFLAGPIIVPFFAIKAISAIAKAIVALKNANKE